MERRDGFLPIYLDPEQGRILLELPRDSTRALLMISQATGLGSNPIGIDRGASGATHVVRFDRDGDRVLVVLENWAYRSTSGNADHARTVAEAFPPSTVAALPLLADEGGRLLVDATDLAMRDWNDVVGTLARSQQGTYVVARDRSTIDRAHTKAFPENTEIDAALTFATTGTRRETRSQSIVPDGRAFTLRQHMSLLKLPDAGFRPRALDPRVGFFGISFKDYARPIQEPLAGPVGGATSPRAREPERSEFADQGTDPLLHRPRHSRADPHGDAAGREVVGGGVRPRRTQGRVHGRVPARRRRPDGRALQRRAVGEPQRARLVGGRRAHRSAHGRDDQGHGAARLASRAHRLQPLRRRWSARPRRRPTPRSCSRACAR